MRIHRLEVEGFGPFRDRQRVDFDAFAGEGIFLIGGKTGAGKSSVLDAVCFALYGGVPRYEDGDKRLRSDHSGLDEPTRVMLEFSTGERRWRIERVPSYLRLKKNGRGTTETPAEARLWEHTGDEWVGRAARPVDVAEELKPILGLTMSQFLQVILLAQGRFARFLLAKNDERQALLRTLFDSRRFGDYEAELERRRRDAAERLEREKTMLTLRLDAAEKLAAQLDDGIDGTLPADERLAVVERVRIRAAGVVEHAQAAEKTAQAAHTGARAALDLLVSQRATQQRRDSARAALAELLTHAGQHDALRAALRAARDAEELRVALDAAHRAADALAAARHAGDRAEAEWTDAGEPADLALEGLRQRADALVGDIATWRAALEIEQRLPELEAERTRHTETIGARDAELAALDARADALPSLIRDAIAEAAAAEVEANVLPAASARALEAAQRLDAAREAEQLAAALERAEGAASRAGKALTRASAHLDDLRDRRFRDHAGELAELLVDGEPCAVCGALEHPAPAARRDDPVTAEQLEAAETAKQAAIDDDAAASAALREASRVRADAVARAAGLDVAAAQTQLDAAQTAQAAARAAVDRHGELAPRARALQDELAQLDDTRARVIAERTDAAAGLAATANELAAAEQRVAAARGQAASVQARIAAAEEVVRRARELADARRARDDATRQSGEADAALDAAVEASPFADAVAVRAALLPATERERIDDLVHAFDAERAAQQQTLLDLELQALPEEPIDTAAAESAAEAAELAWREAVARFGHLKLLATQLADASDAAREADDGLRSLADEVAVVERLAHTVAGRAPNTRKMNLETFVLAAELEEIVAAANLRLAEMSEGRYRLQHTDARAARGAASGLGIEVMDRHTGQARPVQSLSGGETFLASLALALGLAEVVTARSGGITLDTLFIDEGFGSLDPDTREVAMRTLDELRQGGRTVGLISHVEGMQEEVAAQLLVEATPEGPSVIRQGVLVP